MGEGRGAKNFGVRVKLPTIMGCGPVKSEVVPSGSSASGRGVPLDPPNPCRFLPHCRLYKVALLIISI